jgi:branched-chain amino acid transport system permease protein
LGVLTFAQGQVLTWGAFGTLVGLHAGLPIPLAVLLGVVVAGGLSVLIDVTVLAGLRQRGAGEFAYVVATLGVALILENVLHARTGSEVEAFPIQGFPRGAFDLAGQRIAVLDLFVLGTAIAAMLALGYWLQTTRFGRATRAVACSRETAELLGVNSRLVYAVSFFISGGLAGLAGTFVAASTANVSYSAGDPLLFVAFAVIILGGMGSVRGAIAGGLALGLIEVYATVYVSSVFREAIAFLVILVVLLVRPSGLFGEKQSSRV